MIEETVPVTEDKSKALYHEAHERQPTPTDVAQHGEKIQNRDHWHVGGMLSLKKVFPAEKMDSASIDSPGMPWYALFRIHTGKRETHA